MVSGEIDTYAGTGETTFTPNGAAVRGTPLNGPRTMAVAPNGDIFLALREGNAIYRIDAKTQKYWRIAGTGVSGYSGDGAQGVNAKLNGPKGLAYASDGNLYIADTENHVIRRLDLKRGIIATVLGTGTRGDGPESDPIRCALSRPHGVHAAGRLLYVADSEAHRIRVID